MRRPVCRNPNSAPPPSCVSERGESDVTAYNASTNGESDVTAYNASTDGDPPSCVLERGVSDVAAPNASTDGLDAANAVDDDALRRARLHPRPHVALRSRQRVQRRAHP
eukprot:401834-Prorocentrum_minimum.AAC.5